MEKLEGAGGGEGTKDFFGWEAGTRTPIARFRVWSPTIGRPPSSEIEFTKVRESSQPRSGAPSIFQRRAAGIGFRVPTFTDGRASQSQIEVPKRSRIDQSTDDFAAMAGYENIACAGT